MMKKIAKVKYVDSYVDAPKNAQYILRRTCGNLEWVLEEYSKNGEYLLNETFISYDAYKLPEDFHEMLQKSRALMPDKATLWVEKPRLYEGNLDKLNTLYKDFIYKSLPSDIEETLQELEAEEYFWDRMFPEDDDFRDSMFSEYDD